MKCQSCGSSTKLIFCGANTVLCEMCSKSEVGKELIKTNRIGKLSESPVPDHEKKKNIIYITIAVLLFLVLGLAYATIVFYLFIFCISGNAYTCVGGNKITDPPFPRPGDNVRIELMESSTGKSWEYWVGSNLSVSADDSIKFKFGNPWYSNLHIESGSKKQIIPGLEEVKINPLTREVLTRRGEGGPVYSGEDRKAAAIFKVSDDLSPNRLSKPETVTLNVIGENYNGIQNVHFIFRVFPKQSILPMIGNILHYGALTILIIMVILVLRTL